MRALVYARVSTADQADGYSVAHQLDACSLYAAGRGWTVIDAVVDDGVSGGAPFDERPGGSRVLDGVAGGAADAVVAARLDRFVRSVRLWVDLVQFAADHDCAISTADGAFDLATDHGRLLGGILAAVAEFERGLISTRTREGLAAARHAGVRLGQRPHWPRTLARVRELVADGAGCHRVMHALNAERLARPDGSTAWTLGAARGAMRAAGAGPDG